MPPKNMSDHHHVRRDNLRSCLYAESDSANDIRTGLNAGFDKECIFVISKCAVLSRHELLIILMCKGEIRARN